MSAFCCSCIAIGSIRTSVVQHPRVWYSAAGLLPGSCAATARPRRELPCVLAASARPNCRNRSPSYRSRSRLLDGSGGCCPGSRCGSRTGRRLLRRQPRGSCLGRAAPASGGPLKLGRGNRVAASIRPQVRNRLPRLLNSAAAAGTGASSPLLPAATRRQIAATETRKTCRLGELRIF